ncbi:MAG: C10 family peptidase [Bacteroidota bacterium]|nr:C10 family peptidase [Bacteroidota bacterium]
MMYKTIRYMIGVLVCLSLYWNNLQAQQAERLAADFLESKGLQDSNVQSMGFFSRTSNYQEILILESDYPPCFVALLSDNDDFTIVAYSLTNTFSLPESNLLVAEDLIAGVDQRLIEREIGKKSVPAFTSGPLLTTKWSQGDYFNQYCPEDLRTPGGRVWVGCVVVAIGQIINYYDHHNDFILDAAYDSKDYGHLSAWSNGYDWNGMLDEPLDFDLEVSRFLSDLGVLVHANYGAEGTSASSGMALKGLQAIGYSEAYRVKRSDYSSDEWLDLMYDNLSNYSPVFVAGGGHAFVCDGYDENGFLHFNLGGAGIGNGFYSSSVIYGFTVQEAIVAITPDVDIQPPEALVLLESNGNYRIEWNQPAGQEPDGYRIYYNKEDFIETEETYLDLNLLDPGTNNLKVCAISAGSVSRCIGPVQVKILGADLLITDHWLAEAIQARLFGDQFDLPLSINQADLTDMKFLCIHGPLTNPGLLGLFKKLQRLELDATGFNPTDFQSLEKFRNLQTLKIAELNTQDLPELRPLKKIVRLGLKSAEFQDLDFLSNIPDLRALEIINSNLSHTDLYLETIHLEHLIIQSTGLQNLDFLVNMPGLRSLNLAGNQISQIELPLELAKLRCLWLDDNTLAETNWLGHFPHLRYLSIKNNQLTTLGLHARLNELKILEASGNQIKQVRFSFDFPVLEYLDLSLNHLTELPPVLLYLKRLDNLDLSSNSIRRLPKMASHSIKKIDISYNRLTTLPNLSDFQRLNWLDLEGNWISDLNPLLRNEFYTQLNHFNINNNPISQESFDVILPELIAEVEDYSGPADYEPSAPCFPLPGLNEQIYSNRVELSWHNENQDPDQRFEVLFGKGDSLNVISTGLEKRSLSVPLVEGQVFHWQVRNVLQDTVFYSGVYELRTLKGIEIPFLDNFDNYPIFGNLSQQSGFWRISHGAGDTYQDARTESGLSTSGSLSVHILSSTDLTLDLDHLEEGVLWVGFNAFVRPGKSAHFLLANLNGLQLDVFLHNGNGEIFLNGALIEEFDYPIAEWVVYEFAIQGKNDRIFFKRNHEYIINVQWNFRNGLVNLDGLVFCPDKQGFSRSESGYDYFVDDVSVRTTRTSGVDEINSPAETEISFFPNPATDHITISGLSGNGTQGEFSLLNMTGQLVLHRIIPPGAVQFEVNLTGLEAGVYFCQVGIGGGAVATRKLIVAR